MKIENKVSCVVITVVIFMTFYFVTGRMQMNDDGFQYEGFAESLAGGHLDFKSFYGFQGLSFFAVPVFWLTHSHNSIIITSIIFSLLSIPLAYMVGRDFYSSRRAGIYFLILFLLTPYPYTTMFRGFQEAALLFFILLIIYASINKKIFAPLAWAIGGIVKPFSLTLFPLFVKDAFTRKRFIYLVAGLIIGALYLAASYYQTGHLINNAAINSYSGNFNIGNPPPLVDSFVLGVKGYLRVGANLLLHFRKIMISPLVIILGALALWFNKGLYLRKEIAAAIILNFLLVGSLTFSFSKYLLPMTTLFALTSVGYLLKYRWLMWLVLVDSLFVFFFIWDYFGSDYWSNIYVYLLPFWVAIAALLFSRTEKLN